METIYTLIASTFVYGWVYGEQIYFFITGKKEGIRNAPIKS